MKRKLWKGLAGFGACLVLARVAFAQVSAHFDLNWHLLSSGGGSRSSIAYRLDDALGQPAGVVSTGSTYEIRPGFWQWEAAAGWQDDWETLYLPLILRDTGR